jgi:Phage tail lysozyme
LRPRGAHRKTSKFGGTGRHCAPPTAIHKAGAGGAGARGTGARGTGAGRAGARGTGARRTGARGTGARGTVWLAGAAIPAVALVGAYAAYAFHPHDVRAATGSVDSFAVSASPATGPAGHGLGGGAAESDAAASLKVALAWLGRAGSAAAAAHRPAAEPGPRARSASRAHPTARQASRPRLHATPSTSPKPPAACSGNGSADQFFLPANYAAIVDFLTAHGYSDLAAAGIAGNIYQESKGNPESIGTGGGGLIGWTPLPAGYVTGDPAADLQTQLTALLAYNEQWAQYIPALNAATSPVQAADIFMDDFERPGLAAASNRESAAVAVAAACGF